MTGGWPSDQDASGRSFQGNELRYLGEVLSAGVLNPTRGTFTSRLENRFGELLGARTVACASGTAAVHTALAALDLEPGSEVITSPLTDFGGVAPILWQGCVPVFADVDPATLNITAETVAARLTPRTRAVIVTHLLGTPADMREIARVTGEVEVPLIEDCAQAFGATLDGRPVGSFGALACFSLQQTKHITTGEGGLVAARDEALADRVHQFVNKGRIYTDDVPEHHFLSMNYRMTELQGAVGAAQLERLPALVAARRRAAGALERELRSLKGVRTPDAPPGGVASYWRFALRVDDRAIPGGMPRFAARLKERGVTGIMAGYQRPAYEWRVIRERRTFGTSGYPFTLATPEATDYSADRFPGVLRGRAEVLVLPWNEHYTEHEAGVLARLIREVHDELV